MVKALEDMTNEELFRLFPIVISEHNPIWRENYLAEEMRNKYKPGIIGRPL